ncbi:hypothetical protein AM571_CH03380 [Rhizobium etli 8C-3]|uniref:Uncharacterized protein n=1 Tax=Rhizobium etli 8C-3 TaxID=538025 RepID=A0A1L5P7T9_RHIET|nr:hypothetical protein AM571_CH03380 [Rhizobium etli 8C-3]
MADLGLGGRAGNGQTSEETPKRAMIGEFGLVVENPAPPLGVGNFPFEKTRLARAGFHCLR